MIYDANYDDIYTRMAVGQSYTAAELGVAPASMTAMVRRGMVCKIDGKPSRYIRVEQSGMTEKALYDAIVEKCGANWAYVVIFTSSRELGMLCSWNGNTFKDCWGKNFDISDAVGFQVKEKKVTL